MKREFIRALTTLARFVLVGGAYYFDSVPSSSVQFRSYLINPIQKNVEFIATHPVLFEKIRADATPA